MWHHVQDNEDHQKKHPPRLESNNVSACVFFWHQWVRFLEWEERRRSRRKAWRQRDKDNRTTTRPDPAGSATRSKDRGVLESPGKNLYYWIVVQFESKTRFHITCQNVEDETTAGKSTHRKIIPQENHSTGNHPTGKSPHRKSIPLLCNACSTWNAPQTQLYKTFPSIFMIRSIHLLWKSLFHCRVLSVFVL